MFGNFSFGLLQRRVCLPEVAFQVLALHPFLHGSAVCISALQCKAMHRGFTCSKKGIEGVQLWGCKGWKGRWTKHDNLPQFTLEMKPFQFG